MAASTLLCVVHRNVVASMLPRCRVRVGVYAPAVFSRCQQTACTALQMDKPARARLSTGWSGNGWVGESGCRSAKHQMQHRLRVVLWESRAPPLSPRLSETGKERKVVSGGEVEVQSVQPLRRTLRIPSVPQVFVEVRRGVGGSTSTNRFKFKLELVNSVRALERVKQSSPDWTWSSCGGLILS